MPAPNYSEEIKEEEVKRPEEQKIEKKRAPEVPAGVGAMEEREDVLRRRKPTDEEEEEKEKLKQKLEKLELPKDTELEALKEADRMREMQLRGKLNRLLDLAKTQGVPFAVKTAEKMNDACLLDLLHDELIAKGLHKSLE